MNVWRKRLSIMLAGAMLTFGAGAQVSQVQAASALEILLGGAIGMAEVHQMVSKMDDTPEGQMESLKKYKELTGVYDNPAYQERVQHILDTLTQSPKVKRSYVVYVNPDNDINAFMAIGRVMSVNKGTMDLMTDDELAYIMGHEIAHGENKDGVRGLKKQLGVQVAVGAATADAGTASILLGNIAGQYLTKQVFSVSQEKNADELGFAILADSPYNLGGAPMSMYTIREKYGELYQEGLAQIINPNDHPKSSNRINENLQRIYDYSGKKVSVKEDYVYINNKPVYKGEPWQQFTGEERAFFMAGKLARIFHDKKEVPTTVDGSVVYMGNTPVVTAGSSAVAQEVSSAINNAMSGQKQTESAKDKKADSKTTSKDKKADTKTTSNDKNVSAKDTQNGTSVTSTSTGTDSGNAGSTVTVSNKKSDNSSDNKPASASFKKWGNIGD
ncbi:MAG: M48 family metallopeptidase [Veillonella sp.]|uniref:M48 family metallopeptidase n=1 Tax=Veillonella sp. TaxID=1926307 RepID=UPI0025E6B381|nr:M48 family metallopeptidase [Veillonella sp.]MBS4913255.1 M48 family metallopeptidase [Veillonella sp.]